MNNDYQNLIVIVLNNEFRRIGLLPLAADQVDALADENQCFDMVDDFEARLGLSDSFCADIRAMLTDLHEAVI